MPPAGKPAGAGQRAQRARPAVYLQAVQARVRRLSRHSRVQLIGFPPSIVDNRDRVNLDQVIGPGQRRHSHHRVGRLVIPEQRYPGLFHHRSALTSVVEDEDRDLGALLGPGTAGSESAAEVAKRLAGLGRKVTGTDKVAVLVFGFLAGDEYQPGSSRDDDMGVRQGSWQFLD